MAPRWHPAFKMATLYNRPHRLAINVEMERKIPSEAWYSIDDHATESRPPLRNRAEGNCAHKNKNQKNVPG
jgi:hypothetical protein